MTIFIMTISSAACTAAEITAGIRSVILAVRHVAATAAKTRKVDADSTAGNSENTVGSDAWDLAVWRSELRDLGLRRPREK
jgi:hypothetical protein